MGKPDSSAHSCADRAQTTGRQTQCLVETLGGATFKKVISEQDGVYIYQFSRGEDNIVAAFSTAEKQAVSFRKSGSDFSLVDPMGNQTPIQPDGNDNISLSLNGYPIYLFGRGELAYDSP